MARRYGLAEMKSANKAAGEYFFSRDTMKFFKGGKITTRYDKTTGQNYVKVSFPTRTSWYKFNATTGELGYTSPESIPSKIRGR